MKRGEPVPREFYDDVVRQRDAALERARIAEERLAELTDRAMSLKAHELSAPVTAPARESDPFTMLGPKTQLAIDDFAQGDAELRNRLINSAMLLSSATQVDEPDLDTTELDALVAEKIREGDR